MGNNCPKCGGFLIPERSVCKEGSCDYVRCLHCSTYWFEEEKEDKGEISTENVLPPVDSVSLDHLLALYMSVLLKPKKVVSYAKIGKELGLTKQRVHIICKRALEKMKKNAIESGWMIQ